MKQITAAATRGIAIPFLIGEALPAGSFLLTCLDDVKAISAYLLSDLRENTVSGGKFQSPTTSTSSNSSTSIAIRIQALVKKKFDSALKQLIPTRQKVLFLQCAGVTMTARRGRYLKKPPLPPGGRTAARGEVDKDHQALLERIDLLERKLADAEVSVPHEKERAPLIKVSALPAEASDTEAGWNHDSCDEKQPAPKAAFDLGGRCVLCVGGRAALYPEYCRLVEISGGNLLIYRCGPRTNTGHLFALLAYTDMVLCPVDCIDHQAYFAVKRYCKHSGKPCVLLDRSNLSTFSKGVATLAALSVSSAANAKSFQSAKSPPE